MTDIWLLLIDLQKNAKYFNKLNLNNNHWMKINIIFLRKNCNIILMKKINKL